MRDGEGRHLKEHRFQPRAQEEDPEHEENVVGPLWKNVRVAECEVLSCDLLPRGRHYLRFQHPEERSDEGSAPRIPKVTRADPSLRSELALSRKKPLERREQILRFAQDDSEVTRRDDRLDSANLRLGILGAC